MCDTILATGASTAEHSMLFGKNSDRERNEAQAVEYFPLAHHPAGSTLACTYLTIPQVARTYAVLLCQPFWIWGAEMGTNEHGVTIGNEGLSARSPASQQESLTGMDLLRLALERSSSAAEAVEIITALLEQYGQGGNCGHLTPAYYNNGFMIADAHEAYVLETVGRDWLLERVQGIRAMSNGYSITGSPQRMSAGLPRLIHDRQQSALTESNYAEAIGDPQRAHIGNAAGRRGCSTSLMKAREGRLNAIDMMNILRDHGDGDGHRSEWSFECTETRTLCMHAGAERPGQTVGSMVSELRDRDAVHWVTGTAAPCASIFKPLLMSVPLPRQGLRPTDQFDARALWWRHERLHRAALLGDFAKFLAELQPERDALEVSFHQRVKQALDGGNVAERSQVIAECWKEEIETEDRWYAQLGAPAAPSDSAYAAAWERLNQRAGLQFS